MTEPFDIELEAKKLVHEIPGTVSTQGISEYYPQLVDFGRQCWNAATERAAEKYLEWCNQQVVVTPWGVPCYKSPKNTFESELRNLKQGPR